MLLLSDGYPELSNSENEQIGYERVKSQFAEIAKNRPNDIIEELKNFALNWVEDKDPDDDITFVVIKVK